MSAKRKLGGALWRALARRRPDRYCDGRMRTTVSRFLTRSAVGAGGATLGLSALFLLNAEIWREVLAGSLIAWSTAIVLWAKSSHDREMDAIRSDLRRVAEVDLLHARLNQIADRLGIPTIDLDAQLEHVILDRQERLAHFAGLDKLNPDVHGGSGRAFWNSIELGQQPSES